MEVVVDVSVNVIPVSTSVTFTMYSRMTPLVSDDGGGDHERVMASELTLTPVRFWGEALGAAVRKES